MGLDVELLGFAALERAVWEAMQGRDLQEIATALEGVDLGCVVRVYYDRPWGLVVEDGSRALMVRPNRLDGCVWGLPDDDLDDGEEGEEDGSEGEFDWQLEEEFERPMQGLVWLLGAQVTQ
jgi:hypothetical protein